MRARKSGIAAGLAGLLLVLTGCVGIPSAGPVIAGSEIREDLDADSVILPQGPEDDADPQAILQGFVRAGTGPQGDYSVAREFLTPDLAQRWKPNAGVTVSQPGSDNYTQTGERTLEYTVVPVATVDSNGRYVAAEASGPATMQFTFEQVGGQWRISEAPDGIVLTGSSFEQIFNPYSVYFFNPTFSTMVPDLRWFPTPLLARRIVAALLAGPSEWLAPGVVTECPNGTTLGPDGVRQDGNRVVVDLSAEAAESDTERLQRMKLQLTHSLADVTSVTSIGISINQGEVAIPETTNAGPVVEPEVDSRVLLRNADGFGHYRRGEIEPIAGISGQVQDLAATEVSLSRNEQYAAVQAPGGVYAVQVGGEPLLVDARPGLIAPSVDDLEFVWSVPALNPAGLIATDLAGTPHPIGSGLPASGRMLAIEVSRDGARIALLAEADNVTRLYVAAVVREDGVPVSLGPLTELALETNAIDATWVDSVRVATLNFDDGDYRVSVHEIGGLSTSLGELTFGEQIVGGNSIDGLRVLGNDGIIQQPRGTGWQSSNVEADFLGTQR
ncbi:LpqB family beta-propeller domain-containing protein [Diaminobutyricimonas sp. LJ205]|uniref:LpqB family beta-propeller domain-containing protein n=1 Tax=Diaminobutyricimonas sp. LJ205 TaxID=2683590 RepID=UPI0012F50FE1|nr:LpqB family beta-propeller domain-containing protein [Diaminobutyricimonas sp. LJ205]